MAYFKIGLNSGPVALYRKDPITDRPILDPRQVAIFSPGGKHLLTDTENDYCFIRYNALLGGVTNKETKKRCRLSQSDAEGLLKIVEDKLRGLERI